MNTMALFYNKELESIDFFSEVLYAQFCTVSNNLVAALEYLSIFQKINQISSSYQDIAIFPAKVTK